MTPVSDPTGNFSLDLDMGQMGALRITAENVRVLREGNLSRLGAIAAAVRRLLNLEPIEEPQPKPTPQPRKTLLVLFESTADAAACRRLSASQPDLKVIARPALETLTNPLDFENLATALRKSQITGCLLIAASGDGAAPALAAAWRDFESVVQRKGILEIATFQEDGALQVIKTNAMRLAALDKEHHDVVPAPRPDDKDEPDPDP